jgi:hypothetical protein
LRPALGVLSIFANQELKMDLGFSSAFLVVLHPMRDLLLCAKDLFVEARPCRMGR